MAVAETKTVEASGPGLLDRLSVVSLIGLVYVLGSLGIIFGLLPTLAWDVFNLPRDNFLAHAGLILVMLAAAAGLGYLGVRLAGSHPMPGLRAGIFTAFVLVLLLVLINKWISSWLESKAYEEGSWIAGMGGPTFGQILGAVIAIATTTLVARWFFKPSAALFLQRFEIQGWFTATAYKPAQGQRVRRGTILAILVLVGCGIWLLVRPGNPLEKSAENWTAEIPFTGKVRVTDIGDLAAAEERLKAEKFGGPVDALLNGAKDGSTVVIDRYSYQEINRRALNPKSFHRVDSVNGQLPEIFLPLNAHPEWGFQPGKIVTQSDYDKAIEFLKEDERRKGNDDKEIERLAGLSAPRTKELKGDLNYASLTLLPSMKFTLPLLLALVTLWFAWRVVNLPTFADFLIATEAEMNKVSWSTRSKLYQDTIVVLVTLFLMTLFLFVVDIAWSKLLSWKYVGVLQVPEQKEKEEGKELKW